MSTHELVNFPHTFETLQSSDETKTDLELTCTACDEVVCDVEAGDTLAALIRVVNQHECSAAAAWRPATWDDIRTGAIVRSVAKHPDICSQDQMPVMVIRSDGRAQVADDHGHAMLYGMVDTVKDPADWQVRV